MIDSIFSLEHLLEIGKVIAETTDVEVLVFWLPRHHMQLRRCYDASAVNALVDHRVGSFR